MWVQKTHKRFLHFNDVSTLGFLCEGEKIY